MKEHSKGYRDSLTNEITRLNEERNELESDINTPMEMDMVVLKDKCLAWAKEDGIELTEDQVWTVLDYEERYMRELGIVVD